MNILVTGANGFVGAEACKKLIANGDSVRALVRKTSDLGLLAGVEVEVVYGSLTDSASLKAAVAGMDAVCHVAAYVSDWGRLQDMREINVRGTRRLLDLAVEAGVKRFVFISSAAIHSFIDSEEMNEDSPRHKTSYPYCLTKREAEEVVREYDAEGEIEGVILRPGDVYGPGDRTSLLKMADMLEKNRMALIDRGSTLGAFTYVENMADAIVKSVHVTEAAGEAFVITDGIKLTWADYFRKLTAELDLKAPRISVPGPFAGFVAAVLEGVYTLLGIRSRPPLTRYLVEHLRWDFHFSIDKARRILGYEPAVDVDTAILRTAQWYKKTVRKSGE